MLKSVKRHKERFCRSHLSLCSLLIYECAHILKCTDVQLGIPTNTRAPFVSVLFAGRSQQPHYEDPAIYVSDHLCVSVCVLVSSADEVFTRFCF